MLGLATEPDENLGRLGGCCPVRGRVSLAEIGRRLTGTSAKHGIKRCWRFTANPRVEISDAMGGVIRRLLKPKRWRKKPLIVALDWTEVRSFHTLMLAAVLRGRAIPLLWASYPEWQMYEPRLVAYAILLVRPPSMTMVSPVM